MLLCAESQGRREILLENLAKADLFLSPLPTGGTFSPRDRTRHHSGPGRPRHLSGCRWPACLRGPTFWTARRAAAAQTQARETDTDAIIRDLTELRQGLPVVHIEHGVGRYLGLQILDIDGDPAEFCYSNMPRVISFMSPWGPAPHQSVHGRRPGYRAATQTRQRAVEKARRKARERAADVAAQLLDVYARREARQGHAHTLDEAMWLKFCEGFPFEETPDQAAAIGAVKDDMCAPRVMDRLVCGDVGFGKTEVAMRAAFIAAQSGRQSAIPGPTPLLANQHHANFRDRFADWPYSVEVVSRFQSSKDLDDISAG
ncbi:MAG: hypothetical protein CM15mP84_03780 [Cellvibrionales bacterium]|nr:MAG: hypothetical protein CM15mP84_03780 [Cellvibrionales bacterium]